MAVWRETLNLDALEQWEIGNQPLTIVGDDTRGEAHEFGFLSGLARLSDGRVIVATDQSTILAFDSAGNFLSRFARKGSGPAEFTTFRALHRIRGDTLLAYQHFPESVTLFGPDGSYVRTHRVVRPAAQQEFAEFAAFELKSAFPDGSLLVHRHGGERSMEPDQVNTDSVRPLRISLTGEVVADFGTRWERDQMRIATVAASNGGPVPTEMSSTPYLLRSAMWGVVGDRVFYSTGERFNIEMWSPTGKIERIVRVNTARIPSTDDGRGEFLAKGVRYSTARPTREFDPPIFHARADVQGNLWVGVHPKAFGDSSVSYVVLDSTGTARAAVRWRNRPTRGGEWSLVGNWQEIDDHTFTTAATDRDDAFHVIVFPLHKTTRR